MAAMRNDAHTGELKAVKANGELRGLIVFASMFYDQNGTPAGMTTSFIKGCVCIKCA